MINSIKLTFPQFEACLARNVLKMGEMLKKLINFSGSQVEGGVPKSLVLNPTLLLT